LDTGLLRFAPAEVKPSTQRSEAKTEFLPLMDADER